MTTDTRPPQFGRSVAVSLFEGATAAREAVDDLRHHGVEQGRVGMLVPGATNGDRTPSADVSGLLAVADDVGSALLSMGVPEGEARFYAHEVEEGHRTLVVVSATNGDYARARDVLLRHGGYDVQSRGGALASDDDAGVSGGTGAQPVDITDRWEDVQSRYEMLWQQHYGTSDATWEQMQPVYRFAWQVANEPSLRGRPWSEAEAAVREAWLRTDRSVTWDAVSGPIQDVWQDVAEEAAMGAEGGAARRVPSRRAVS